MTKYALVTGGSRGIGRAVCIKLAEMGYHVLVNCVSNTAEAEKTLDQVRQAGQDGEVLQFDVSNRAQTRKVLDAWMEAHPEEYIEVLVNNAGIRRDNLMVFMPDEDWDSVLGTSLGGFYNVTQPLLQPMLRHKYGRIVSLASVSGLKGMPGQANYSAAKGGIIAATKALAQEVARKNVTVNAVAPGFIQTDMVEGLDQEALRRTIPANRFGTPEEVAGAVHMNTLEDICQTPVRFSEIDSMRCAWHGSYVLYLEDGRESFGRRYPGIGYADMQQAGIYAPLYDLHLTYRAPLRLNDVAEVHTRYVPRPGARLDYEYRIYRAADHTLCAEARTVQLFIDPQGQLMVDEPDYYRLWKARWLGL